MRVTGSPDHESSDQARERLRELIAENGFLTSSTGQLLSRSGRSLSWMLYTPAISMTAEGSRLAGRCLLEQLERFKSSHIAAHGYTGLPLMAASLCLAGARYRGLVVRDERDSGDGGVVVGDGDRPGPVVLIDDSLVSGTAFFRAARLLEEDGFQVEGLVCLVEFPGRGGRASAEACGYRVEAVYNLERDFDVSQFEPAPSTPSLPSASDPPLVDPLVIARRVAEAWPGADLEAEEAACMPGPSVRSGLLVEFRDRHTGRLVAREGSVAPAGLCGSCTSAVAAAVKAVMRRTGGPIQSYGLGRLQFAVRLLSAAEEVEPSEIDAERHGLIVQSQLNPSRVGYALGDGRKRTEIAAYVSARRMAGLAPAEPHNTYRCLEQVLTETGCAQFSSQPSDDLKLSAATRTALASMARAEISGIPADSDVDAIAREDLSIRGVGVGWYDEGRVLGCWLSWGSSLIPMVRRSAARAWQQSGRSQPTGLEVKHLSVLITILDNPRDLGELSADAAAESFDRGEETLVAKKEGRSAAVFPHFVCQHGWSGDQTAQLVLRKAGIPASDRAVWSAYRTTSWLDGKGGQSSIEHGFPVRSIDSLARNERFRRSASAVAGFIAGLVCPDGLPAYQYDPLSDSVVQEGPIGRVILALDALGEAGHLFGNEEWVAIATTGLACCVDRLSVTDGLLKLDVPGRPPSVAAMCELLAALASWSPEALEHAPVVLLSQHVRALFKSDGMISDLAEGFRLGGDQDIQPGVALVALGKYCLRAGTCIEMGRLAKHLGWYSRRFRLCRPWAMIGWQMQGWGILSGLAGNSLAWDFVFEMADWAISRQLTKNGAFLTDLDVDGPGFHTAYIAEGVVEAWRLAADAGLRARANRYANSWQRSVEFMRSLTFEETDGSLLANPGRAKGGVRSSATDSHLRIDYAAHLLRALVRGIALIERPDCAERDAALLPEIEQSA